MYVCVCVRVFSCERLCVCARVRVCVCVGARVCIYFRVFVLDGKRPIVPPVEAILLDTQAMSQVQEIAVMALMGHVIFLVVCGHVPFLCTKASGVQFMFWHKHCTWSDGTTFWYRW